MSIDINTGRWALIEAAEDGQGFKATLVIDGKRFTYPGTLELEEALYGLDVPELNLSKDHILISQLAVQANAKRSLACRKIVNMEGR